MYFLALLKRNFTNITSVILSAAILLVAVPAHADVHAGVEAYKQGDYATALREFTELANNGDPRAQYNLAVMYLKGHGVDKNLAKAFELQLSAADSGLAGAQHGLAIMYYRGEAVKRDVKKAAKWFRRVADLGFPKSQLNLAVMYSAGQGVKRNDAEVVKWTTLAASRGLPEALFRLGRMYEHGEIFIQSKKDAIYWYGQAGERGYKNGEVQAKRLTALLAPKSSVKATTTQDTPNKNSGPESKTRNWRAQLASFRTERGANRAWDKLKPPFPR